MVLLQLGACTEMRFWEESGNINNLANLKFTEENNKYNVSHMWF